MDLRFINKHLRKTSVKFEDLRVALHYLEKGHFMFSFDIRSGYHYVLIFPPHQSFLGFSWFYKGKTTYFSFRFLPFGFSSAPYIFTELFRPLVAYWRQQGIHIVAYLYDGLGEVPSYQVTLDHSTKVKSDVVHSGFVPNSEKSIWVPTLVVDWLGFTPLYTLYALYFLFLTTNHRFLPWFAFHPREENLAKHYLVAQCSFLLITVISLLSFAVVA